MEKNSVLMGFLLGAVVPVFGYVAITGILDLFVSGGMLHEVKSSGMDQRTRTVLLISICCNLLPFNYARRYRWDDTMRGVIFPTLVYVGYWLFRYYNSLV